MTITTTNDSAALDSITTSARPASRLGKRLAAVALGAVAAASFAVAAPADAAVVSSTGASVTTVGSCGGGAIAFSQANYGFDYARTITYGYGYGYGNWSGWTAMGQGIKAVAANVGYQDAYVAVYVQYADWNGYQWEYGGEWVTFNGSYWCYV